MAFGAENKSVPPTPSRRAWVSYFVLAATLLLTAFAARQWTLLFATQAAFDSSSKREWILLVAAVVALVSLLFFLITRSPFTARRVAERRSASSLQRRSEQDLRESEEQYRSVAETASDAIFTIDEESKIIFANASAERIFGYRVDEMQGSQLTILMPEYLRHLHRAGLNRYLETGERHISWKSVELPGLHKDGHEVPLEISFGEFKRNGRRYFTGIIRDISARKRTAEDLQESEQKLRLFVENAPAAIAMFDREMRYVAVSRRWLVDNNLEGRDITGLSHYEVVPGLPEHWKEGHKRALAGAIERAEEEEYRRPNGTTEWLRWEVRPWLNIHEQIAGVIIFTENITDRKRAEKALHAAERSALSQYESLLGRLVPLAQALGTARDLRTIFQALLDFTLVSMPCVGLFIALYDERRDERRAVFAWGDGAEVDVSRLPPMPIGTGPSSRAVRSGQIITTDDYLAATEGHTRVRVGENNGLLPRSALSAPMTVMGRIVGTVEVQSYEPAAYRKEHATAIDMASNLAAVAIENLRLFELERGARAEAEMANRLKDEFLTTLSHELRTPLTSILGWSSLLRSQEFDAKTTARAVETIERNARAQTQLIDDLLDVSRIITGKLRLDVKPTDPAPIIEAAVESARPAAEAKDLRLQVLLDPSASPVLGDADRLQQIVWNLLSNAIKFTRSGGRVEVRLARNDAFAEISVRDTGQGIRAEFLPFVFDRFRQADGRITRIHGGLGLGLAIVRHLVELHGGAIRAESGGEDQGATFTVRLPLIINHAGHGAKKTNEVAAETGAAESSDGARLNGCESLEGVRVLVVDDDRDTREFLSLLLGQCGALVTLASSVHEALEVFARDVPDVLISDIGMPNEDGYELIRRVRALPRGRGGDTPAAALTAYAGAEDRERAARAGYQEHIPKPIVAASLTDTIARLARRNGDTDTPAG